MDSSIRFYRDLESERNGDRDTGEFTIGSFTMNTIGTNGRMMEEFFRELQNRVNEG